MPIATAVQQAGKAEIERLKGELAKELEKERQAFAREVQREGHEAAKALERFRSELTVAAEVRRRVAEKKVEILGQILTLGDECIPDYETEMHDLQESFDALGLLLRTSKHLFPERALKVFRAYHDALSAFSDSDPASSANLDDAAKKLVALARAELHVEEPIPAGETGAGINHA